MVTSINNGQTNIYFGLSTDSRPADAPNGSTLHEMDTSAEYLYDAENDAWIKQNDGGSGGGSLPAIESGDAGKVLTVNADEDAAVWATPGGGASVLVVHGDDGTLDKTWQEIHDAMVSSGAVYVNQNGGVQLFIFAGGNGLGQYHVDTSLGDEFYTDSADGYPTSEEPAPGPSPT